MRVSAIVAMLALASTPAFAQIDRLYVGGAGGFAAAPDGTSGTVVGEVGWRVAPSVYVIGDVGQFHNVQPSQLQPAIDNETLTLLNSGLTVTGKARVPAWYTTGGVRVEVPIGRRILPYFSGTAGLARITPSAQFTYSSGTLVGASPSAGDDVTAQLVSIGDFIQPPATNALMISAGGGIETPITPHMALDVGYRLSHIAVATPVNAQSVIFGFEYRF